MASYRGLAALAGLILLAGCTSSSSVNQTAGDRLPRPQVVVVQDFAVAPDEVRLDPGLSDMVEETLKGTSGSPRTARELEVGRQVASALAEKLMIEIEDLGLPARRGADLPPGVRIGLIVGGQFVAINEGNEAERVVIGLVAGRSDVRLRAQVFEVTPQGRRLVDEIEVDAKSGLKPGLAETLAAGALTGGLSTAVVGGVGLNVVNEEFGSSVVVDADRAAKGLAKQLAALFAEQGWTR
jgi:hypothetical protein